ncbi:MAG: hypothetical protein EOP38_07335 [Rubrivivax sp.]|nr:MAG: hypothetical protein EOP38_07335 [Rubrivivax sp.]
MTTKTTTTTARELGPRLKDEDKPVSPPHGNTHSNREDDDLPRMPHEHDESADSQRSPPREVIQQAHRDVSRGLTDTDKGPPMDDAYKKQATGGKQGS